MKTVGLAFFLFMMSVLASGQELQTGAPPAASGPNYDLSLGYSYLTMAVPGAGHVDLYGLDAGGQIHLIPRWAAVFDSNYARSFDVPGTRHEAYILSLHAGPVFYPIEHGDTRLFVHGLAGAALEDGALPISRTQYLHGWLLRPSYAVGGGAEHALAGVMALRLSGDYLRTQFFGSAGTVKPQNNFRMTVSLVFHLRRPYAASR